MNGLAEVLKSRNRLLDSEKIFKKALSFGQQNLLPNHPEILNSMNGLAEVYLSQN